MDTATTELGPSDGPGRDRERATFLFTDLVGSTELWEQMPEVMAGALVANERLLSTAISGNGGRVFKNTGDGLAAVFDSPADATRAAIAIQSAVDETPVADGGLAVRIGINCGEAHSRDGDYFGGAVNLASRVMNEAGSGQVVLSESAADIADRASIDQVQLRDLGEHWLRGYQRPHRLYQLRHPALAAPQLDLSSRIRGKSGIPQPNTSLVGRRADIARALGELESRRVVTLAGPAGVGKSRLAQEVTRRAADRFVDGVCWCSLAEVDRAEHVAPTVAAALGVPERAATETDAIVDWLQPRMTLLVLDCCEHVLSGVQPLVAEVAARCARVRTLITSREPIQVDGESVLWVEPLDWQVDGSADAEQLFLDRARHVGAELQLDDADRERLARICDRLDGLPLAIELAASRARTMSLAQIEAGLDHRFSLLVRRRRPAGSAERHLSLESAIRFSYDALSEPERRLFEAVGLFNGGCDQSALDHLARSLEDLDGDPGLLVWDLVDKSMVVSDTRGAVARFTQLETLREFALARLRERPDAADLRHRHAQYYCEFAEQVEVGRGTHEERRWLDAQLLELQNLRAAVDEALEVGDLDIALRIYVTLYELALFQGRTEVFDWLDPTAHLDRDHELLPAALAMWGLRQDPLGPVSLEIAERAVQLFEERGGREHRLVLFARGFAEAGRHNWAAAAEAYHRTVDVIERSEGRNGRWINARSLAAGRNLDPTAVEDLLRDARAIGQPTGTAFALVTAASSISRDDPERALSLALEAAQLAREVSNEHARMYASLMAARLVESEVDPSTALGYVLGALEAAVALREHEAIWRTIGAFDAVLRRMDQDELADELVGPWMARFPGRFPGRERRPVSPALRRGAGLRPQSLRALLDHSRSVADRARAAGVSGSADDGEDLPEDEGQVE